MGFDMSVLHLDGEILQQLANIIACMVHAHLNNVQPLKGSPGSSQLVELLHKKEILATFWLWNGGWEFHNDAVSVTKLPQMCPHTLTIREKIYRLRAAGARGSRLLVSSWDLLWSEIPGLPCHCWRISISLIQRRLPTCTSCEVFSF